MGWLRDSMRASGQAHRSFGAVARAALAHPEWPKHSRPQPRSLAALLSKIDRGLELEWLADRPAVQHVLAEVLSTPRASIEAIVGVAAASAEAGRRRIRLDDLPFASPLDLAAEALPPGIPATVRGPATWNRTWWLAPSGSGRSLAAAWLEARALATVTAVADFRLAGPELATEGPVFVELWSEAADRGLRPPKDALCVAAPFLPSAETSSEWNVIESDPPSSWIEALVHWLALRLPRDGHFVPVRALEWLRGAIDEGAVDGLGSALGLAGIIDRYGVADIERRGLSRLARRFVEDRIQAIARDDGADAAWLGEHTPEVLQRMGVRLLTDSEDAWDTPRSFEEWVTLVPPEYRDTVDAEWLRVSLARSSSPPTAKELERALRDMSPGAFRVVRTLERAGLLRRTHGDLLALAPRWLAKRWSDGARLELVQGSPEGWGEAMLAPRSAGPTLRAVLARATEAGDDVLDELLEIEAPRSPEQVAALEAGFRVAGISLLCGVEVPVEVATALWDQQIPLLVERGDTPRPRLEHQPRGVEDEPLLDLGVFHLAALALSELLPEGSAAEHPVLRPWKAPAVPPGLGAVLDSIWSVVKRVDPDGTPWALEAFSLAERLGAALSSRAPDAPRATHPLEWPGRVLDAVLRDGLTPEHVNEGTHPALVRALLAFGARRGISSRVIIRALWRAWAESPGPVAPLSPLSPSSPLAKSFYADAPPDALSVLLSGHHVDGSKVPWGVLPEAAWRKLLETGSLRGNPAAFRAIPPHLVGDAVRVGALTAAEIETLWVRAPEAVDSALEVSLSRAEPLAWQLVRAAPANCTGPVVRRLRAAWLGAAARESWIPASLVRELLHERVTARAPGWREAFDLLLAIP